MIKLWILYLMVDGEFLLNYPFHFTTKEQCDIVGQERVMNERYEKHKCIQDVYRE